MCGLCGVYSINFSTPEYKLFESLLYLNALRGTDSTGIIRVNEKKSIQSRKSLLPSFEFIKEKTSDIIHDNFEDKKPLLLMGHTRAATKGAVTLKNAHPFSFPNVIGMHNGTINKMFEGRKDFETDSEALYKLINDRGLHEALEEVEAYDSSYALQFVDRKNKTLNFILNDRRPLHFTYLYQGGTLIWSSESLALEMALKRENYSYNKGWNLSEKDKIFTLHKHQLLTIPIGDNPNMSAKLETLDIKARYGNAHGFFPVPGGRIMGTSTKTGGGTHTRRTTRGGWWETTATGYKYHPITEAEPETSHQALIASLNEKDRTKPENTSAGRTSTPMASTSGEYRGFRDALGKTGLQQLDWLKETSLDDSDALDNLFEQGVTEDQLIIRGDVIFTESEMDAKLRRGCICCGMWFTLEDPHDFGEINKTHWGGKDGKEYFSCDACYTNPSTDWVKYTIDGTWDTSVHETDGEDKENR